MNDHILDADRIWAYESYNATLFQISSDGEDREQPFPLGFTTTDAQTTKLPTPPDPWMWWH